MVQCRKYTNLWQIWNFHQCFWLLPFLILTENTLCPWKHFNYQFTYWIVLCLLIKGSIQFNKSYKNPCFYQTVRYEVNNEVIGRERRLRCLPYFFIIGFPKCGTSDLWNRLALHPDVVVRHEKESFYLDDKRIGRCYTYAKVPAHVFIFIYFFWHHKTNTDICTTDFDLVNGYLTFVNNDTCLFPVRDSLFFMLISPIGYWGSSKTSNQQKEGDF